MRISHDEIWDDSALLRSWDAAVKEYEYYHSLAAQGLDVDAVLDKAGAAEANGEPLPLGLNEAAEEVSVNRVGEARVQADEQDAEEGEIGEEDADERMPTVQERQAALQRAGLLSENRGDSSVADTSKRQATDGAPPLPPPADQTLENVKMAYYWAGYYSGLYDGQRQSTAQNGSEHAATGAS